MKKMFLLIALLFINCTTVFAEYKPIPKNLSFQYKMEMEQIIDKEFPKAINNADNYVKDAENYYNQIIKNGFNKDILTNMILITEVCIPASEIDLYSKLLETTYEKYLNIKYEPLGTDSTNPFAEILYLYFKDNNVNTTKLRKIGLYEEKQIKVVEEYIKQVEKLRP